MNPFKSIFILAICLLISLPFFAQVKAYEDLKINTSPLKAGQKITLEFNPEKFGFDVKGAPMYAIMLAYTKGESKAYDAPVLVAKGKYTAQFTIPVSSDAVVFKFVQGDEIYSNHGDGFIYPVYDQKGKEKWDAYYSLYMLSFGSRAASISTRNENQGKVYLEKWYARDDVSSLPFFDKAKFYASKKDTASLCKVVSTMPSLTQFAEKELTELIKISRMCNQKKSQEITEFRNSKFPKGDWYYKIWQDSINKIKSLEDKEPVMNAFLEKHTGELKKNPSLASNMYLSMITGTLRSKDLTALKKYSSYLEKDKELSSQGIAMSRMLLSVLSEQDTLTDEGLNFARHLYSVSESRLSNLKDLPENYSPQLYRLEAKGLSVSVASILSEYLSKKGQYSEAVPYAKSAAEFSKWAESIYNWRYFNALSKTADKATVIEAMKPAFRNGGYHDKIKSLFSDLYQDVYKSDGKDVMDKLLAEHMQKQLADTKRKMLEIQTPDFVLKDREGKEIKKEDLKGKVVFMDFWATWCKPCIGSFPAMQKLYEANKHRNDVAFLFVNTMEGKEDRMKTVNDFFKTRPFTFPVAIDEKDIAGKAFEINALPTKLVLDKEGIIRYRSMGTGADEQKSIDELQSKIDAVASLPYVGNKVSIKGKLINFPSNVELEDFSETQGFCPPPADRVITADVDGNFDITFKAERPQYYRFGRNVLYFSPGDKIEAVVDHDNYLTSTFKGRGSDFNDYLKKTPFPKAGSFLQAGKNLSTSASRTIEKIDSLTQVRRYELEKLNGKIRPELMELEKANIVAHQINSYITIKSYVRGNIKDPNLAKAFMDSVEILTKDKINTLFETIRHSKYLELTAFRDICYKMDLSTAKNDEETVKLQEWVKAKKISFRLNDTDERAKLAKLKMSIDSLQSKLYKGILLKYLDEKLAFAPGDLAKDFEVVTPDGKTAKLSSLKGKVIYIDIWATWCGPCMAEMPHFEKLKEKYKDNMDVSFVSLSVDDTDKVWLNNLNKRNPGGIQWRINRAKLIDYNVTSLPRCIVIDKNFNIVSLYAPNPSEATISKILDKLLTKI